jgi:hypothetical protein
MVVRWVRFVSACFRSVPQPKYVPLKRIAQTMKSVLLDWPFSRAKSRERRVNPIQTFLPMEALVPPEMAELEVVQVDKAAWVTMVDRVVLLGKAVREALVAKAVVGKRGLRVKAG